MIALSLLSLARKRANARVHAAARAAGVWARVRRPAAHETPGPKRSRLSPRPAVSIASLRGPSPPR